MIVSHEDTVNKELTPEEKLHLENIKVWLDCLRDWLGLMLGDEDYGVVPDSSAPAWLAECSRRVRTSLWAPVDNALPEPVAFTPYQCGYVFGLLRWAGETIKAPVPIEVKKALKRLRLSKGARREQAKMWNSFLIDIRILQKSHGRLRVAFSKEYAHFSRIIDRFKGDDEVEFLKGLAAGRQGVGHNVPGDKSTDATDIYLALMSYWRWVARLNSVTELHLWLMRTLGRSRVRPNDKKRIEKICERIGLKLSERGRPKNPTLGLPG